MKKKIIFLGIALAIVAATFLVTLSESTSIAPRTKTRYEYYTTGANCISPLSNTRWVGMTFTVGTDGPNVSFFARNIRLPLCKVIWSGYSVGEVIVSIRNASNPSGPDLACGSINGDLLNRNDTMWYNISISPGLLQQGGTYLIAARAPYAGGNFMAFVGWACDSTGEYPGGMNKFSYDGGQTWSDGANPDGDMLFEIWGNNGAICTPISSFIDGYYI